jgi:hypothetical protein
MDPFKQFKKFRNWFFGILGLVIAWQLIEWVGRTALEWLGFPLE